MDPLVNVADLLPLENSVNELTLDNPETDLHHPPAAPIARVRPVRAQSMTNLEQIWEDSAYTPVLATIRRRWKEIRRACLPDEPAPERFDRNECRILLRLVRERCHWRLVARDDDDRTCRHLLPGTSIPVAMVETPLRAIKRLFDLAAAKAIGEKKADSSGGPVEQINPLATPIGIACPFRRAPPTLEQTKTDPEYLHCIRELRTRWRDIWRVWLPDKPAPESYAEGRVLRTLVDAWKERSYWRLVRRDDGCEVHREILPGSNVEVTLVESPFEAIGRVFAILDREQRGDGVIPESE